MNTLEQFLKEQKEVERYGQYQDMVQEMIDVRKENKELKEEVKRLISGSNMMNNNINNTLYNLLEVYNKSITHHKEINEIFGKNK